MKGVLEVRGRAGWIIKARLREEGCCLVQRLLAHVMDVHPTASRGVRGGLLMSDVRMAALILTLALGYDAEVGMK